MSKIRFTTTDVIAMVRDIRGTIIGQRLANIYDLNDKTYMFKFSSAGVSEKILLLMESGIRFHTTKYFREKNDLPSPFAMKLRRYLRTKRVEDVRQIGDDRVVDFKFGSGDDSYHIILELYAKGNIVLTDSNYVVIALLRSHIFDADADVALRVGELYPMSEVAQAHSLSDESCSAVDLSSPDCNYEQFVEWAERKALEAGGVESINAVAAAAAAAIAAVSVAGESNNEESPSTAVPNELSEGSVSAIAPKAIGQSKKSKAKKLTLRQLLLSKDSGVSTLGAEIIDHCLISSDLSPSTKVDPIATSANKEFVVTAQNFVKLLGHISDCNEIMSKKLNKIGSAGYILLRPVPITSSASVSAMSSQVKATEFDEFVPFLFAQHKDRPHLAFPSFDQAADEYFCKVEEQKLDKQARDIEMAAEKKINSVRNESENMLRHLNQHQQTMELSARLVEEFAEEIDKACLVINSAVSSGMPWDSIAQMVANEANIQRNPIASLIVKMDLEKNKITVQLENLYSTAEESEQAKEEEIAIEATVSNNKKAKAKAKAAKQSQNNANKKNETLAELKPNSILVDIRLELSAFANANLLFANKKAAQVKEQKTVEASTKALQVVEEQTTKALDKQNLTRTLRAARKVHWFEKFNWFITTEGYLVLSGRDAQQNELLVKRYMRDGDAYVHADLAGAASCIVRAKHVPITDHAAATGSATTKTVISPLALQEAGCASVCRSVAWTNKVVTSAWWVHASQVSKSAPSGEYLTTGSFMIYGKKNFLPPSALEMGFAILFRLADSSVANHTNERRDRALCDEYDMQSVYSEAFDRYGIDCELLHPNAAGSEGNNGDSSNNNNSNSKKTRVVTKNAKSTNSNSLAAIVESKATSSDDEDSKGPEEEDEDLEDEQVDKCREDDIDPEDEEPEVVGQVVAFESLKPLKKGINSVQQQQQKQKQSEKQKQQSDKASNIKGAIGNSNTKDNSSTVSKAPKKLSKRAARKYADQDDEDRELAMIALGHKKPEATADSSTDSTNGGSTTKKSNKKSNSNGKQNVVETEDEILNSYRRLLAELPQSSQDALLELVKSQKFVVGDIDEFEVKSLLALEDEGDCKAVVDLFAEGCIAKGSVANKSGFLAGILRRYVKEKNSKAISRDTIDSFEPNIVTAAVPIEAEEEEEAEIQAILEEEGILAEEEGKAADELEKLTGKPLTEDQLLYAIPVCGPYASLQQYKYRVKLTPGTLKRGKVFKQAMEVFNSTFSNKESSAPSQEKLLLKGVQDTEAVAVLIGDARLSVPGLQQAKQQVKKIQRGQKKKKDE